MKVELLSRQGCGLCEEAARGLRDLKVPFEVVDVDGDSQLAAAYGDSIPVVMIDDREVARAPLTLETLRRIEEKTRRSSAPGRI